MKTLVIIPAYNEEASLSRVIEDIKEKVPDADYLVVNDCSQDGSLNLLEKMDAVYLNCPVNLGIGGAVQAGYRYALKYDYDFAVQVDGDGQHDAAYIPRMVELLAQGEADVVIGSRFIEGEGFQSSAMRRTGIVILSWLIRILCGYRVKDVTSGFRAVNKAVIRKFAAAYPDDYPEPEVIPILLMDGRTIKEIPVVMRERESGVSSINVKKSVYYMLKVSLAIIICRIGLGIRTGKFLAKGAANDN